MTKYAYYDSTLADPSPVIGWYDSDGFNAMTLKTLPASDLLVVSDAQWDARYPGPWAVQSGALVAYTPPPTPVPLKTQAQSALAIARQTVWDEYGSINEPTPDAWVTYLKALMAIANGTDTASTTLPTAPTS